MRRLALLALVLGAAALAQFPQHRLFEQPNLQRFVAAVSSAVAWGGGFFSFASADAGYLGLDVAVDLCTAADRNAPAWDSGTWSCWTAANGNVAGATLQWRDAGTWTMQSDTILPSGPNGSTMTSVRTTTGAGLETQAYASAPTALSACAVWAGDDFTDINFFGQGYGGSAAATGWLAERTAANSFLSRFSDGTTLTNGGSVALTSSPGQLDCSCLRYVYSGTPGTTSTSQACNAAGCGTANTSSRGPINNASLKVNFGKDSTYVYKGRTFALMSTEKDLGATALTAICGAVVAHNPRGVTSDGDAGVALAFVRATVATCPADTTGAAVSTLPSGRPCITQGGLLVEAAATNLMLRSDQFTDPAWVHFTEGDGGDVTHTADLSLAPNGTLTADHVTWQGSGPTDSSGIRQDSLTAVAYSGSVYSMGLAGDAGSFDIAVQTAGAYLCRDCTYAANAYTRCELPNVTSKTAGMFLIGNLSSICDGGTHVAQTVALWGAQVEAGASVTSYIPTTSAAATRNLTAASFTLGADAPAGNLYSMAVSKTGNSDLLGANGSAYFMANPVSISDTSGKGVLAYQPSNLFRCFGANSAGTSVLTGTKAATTPGRMACWADGVLHGTYTGTTLTDSAAQTGTWGAMRYVDIGSASLLNVNSGIYSGLCISPDSTVCR